MVYNCVAANCTNVSSDSVSLFAFPKDLKLRLAWTRQVQRTRAYWNGPTQSSRLCSEHFDSDQFDSKPDLCSQFNISYRHKFVLKKDAVPSIFHRHSAVPQSSPRPSSASTTATRPVDVPVTSVSASPGASGCDAPRKRSSSTTSTSSCDPDVGTSQTSVTVSC